MNLRHLLLLLPAAAIAGVVLGQGPLAPPGAPAAVMKTLDQIEPRTPISSLPFTISQPGSYYLSRSLSVASGDAITIAANDVTLDLSGFTLSSTAPSPGSGTAILLTNSKPENIAIRNGHIRSTTSLSGATFSKSGFQNGIGFSAEGVNNSNLQISDVNVVGVAENGIALYTQGNVLVERCSVQTCSGTGIAGTVIRHCSVTSAGGIALEGKVVSHSVGRREGILSNGPAINARIVENCEGVSPGGGITCFTVSNSTGTGTSGDGIRAQSAAINCIGTSTSGYGISAENASNCQGVSDSDYGMRVDRNATNCYGRSASNYGMRTENASNCEGISDSGIGMLANRNATNCYGESTSGQFGLYVPGTASSCSGKRPGGNAIVAGIAIGCTVGAGNGTISSPQKHLGTP